MLSRSYLPGGTRIWDLKGYKMKKVFKVTDKKMIAAMLHEAGYGVLALASSTPGEHPYAVPVNFVYLDNAIYFHSSPKGKKMEMIRANSHISFNVVADETIIPSYFSSTEGPACPASSFFKSVTIDGVAETVTSRDEIAAAFTALMQKLQPEGNYIGFNSDAYDKHFAALAMVRIDVKSLSAKFKFGQPLSQERFAMVIEHLKERGREIDLLTATTMQQLREEQETS